MGRNCSSDVMALFVDRKFCAEGGGRDELKPADSPCQGSLNARAEAGQGGILIFPAAHGGFEFIQFAPEAVPVALHAICDFCGKGTEVRRHGKSTD
jgi:hypothetical protein